MIAVRIAVFGVDWIIIDCIQKTKKQSFTTSNSVQQNLIRSNRSCSIASLFITNRVTNLIRINLLLALSFLPLASIAQPEDDSPIKFAFYSSSWGESSTANLKSGLRLVVENQTDFPIQLNSIEFLSSKDNIDPIEMIIDLNVPAGGLAEKEMNYFDLISVNQCVDDTLKESWKLVEISNYTLNPSVRRLIIEDTNAFRIYQCVATVNTHWDNKTTTEQHRTNEWVLYHFESSSN